MNWSIDPERRRVGLFRVSCAETDDSGVKITNGERLLKEVSQSAPTDL
jgi:hypothetical protein